MPRAANSADLSRLERSCTLRGDDLGTEPVAAVSRSLAGRRYQRRAMTETDREPARYHAPIMIRVITDRAE